MLNELLQPWFQASLRANTAKGFVYVGYSEVRSNYLAELERESSGGVRSQRAIKLVSLQPPRIVSEPQVVPWFRNTTLHEEMQYIKPASATYLAKVLLDTVVDNNRLDKLSQEIALKEIVGGYVVYCFDFRRGIFNARHYTATEVSRQGLLSSNIEPTLIQVERL